MRDSDKNRRERVLATLGRLGVEYELKEHPAMFSEKDHDSNGTDIGVTILKNLFIRNKNKSRYYLYTLPLAKRADLAALADNIGESRFSFGNEAELWDKMNITPGSVSPLNIIDVSETDIEFLLDSEIFSLERFGVHPNDNTASVIITPEALTRVLEAEGCRYRIVL